MHPEIIKAEIRKRGKTLRQLSVENGFCEGAVGVAIKKPWLRVEKIIAAFIGVKAEKIWPERYKKGGVKRCARK